MINQRQSLWTCVFMATLILFSSCQELKTPDPNQNSKWVDFSSSALSFTDQGGSKEVSLEFADGLLGHDFSIVVDENGREWCEAYIDGKIIAVRMIAPAADYDRTTTITVRSGLMQRVLPVTQYARVIEDLDDRAIVVASATASSQETGFEIANTYDNLADTYFISSENPTLPVTLEYTFEQPEPLSYALYYPRTDDSDRSGAFGQFEVWVKGSGNYIKVGDYDNAEHTQRACKINMPKNAGDITAIKFVVNSGLNDRVSASAIKFYESPESRMGIEDIFSDQIYSELKEGITGVEVLRMTDPFFRKIALGLSDGSYSTQFRVKAARPYQTPSIRSAANKHGAYSLRDGLTGIYVEKSEDMMIYVGPTKGQTIKMLIQDLETTGFGGKTYTLTAGLNRIKAENKGLIYIENFTSDDIPLLLETEADKRLAEAKTVNIHFVNGYENGYFDGTNPEHDQAFWVKMLKSSKSQDIDVVGKYFHITWNVSDYLKGSAGGSTPTEILKTVANYDSLVYWEWDLMGHIKYNTSPRNRSYFRANYTQSGAAAAGANQTWYRRNPSNWTHYSQIFCEPSAFASRSWGPAHEVGHHNQTTGLKWVGMGEITNNIHSRYVGYKISGGGPSAAQYADATKYLTTNGDPFTVFNGSTERDSRLIVFWQLFVYMTEVRGTDFYKDLYQHFRVTPNVDTSGDITHGAQQLDFVRQSCNIAQLNLVDFFKNRGFLTAVDPVITVNDYTPRPFRITQAQIDTLIAEIEAKYPKPTRLDGTPITDLHLITDSNKNSYK